jgi:hypothetical protein
LVLGVLVVYQAAAAVICLAQEPAKSTQSEPEKTDQGADSASPAPALINEVLPEVVYRNAEGKVEGVRYDELTPMLNEVQ